MKPCRYNDKWLRSASISAASLPRYVKICEWQTSCIFFHVLLIWNKDKLRLWNYLRNILVSTLFLRFLWSCSFSIARTQCLVGSSRWKHDDCVSEVFFPVLPLVQTSKVSIPWLTLPNKLDMRHWAKITVCIIRDLRTFFHHIHMRWRQE